MLSIAAQMTLAFVVAESSAARARAASVARDGEFMGLLVAIFSAKANGDISKSISDIRSIFSLRFNELTQPDLAVLTREMEPVSCLIRVRSGLMVDVPKPGVDYRIPVAGALAMPEQPTMAMATVSGDQV